MFKNKQAFGSFSVNDIDKAKDFYSNKLGLHIEEIAGSEGNFYIHDTGTEKKCVYSKPNHEPASFTILNFSVDNIEKAVDELTSRGIQFEHYDGDFQTNEIGIAQQGTMKSAWFKDPAGNILSVIEGD